MSKENVSPDLRLIKVDQTKKYLLRRTIHNGLMSEKYKKMCRTLNYFDPFPLFVSVVSEYVSISAFAH